MKTRLFNSYLPGFLLFAFAYCDVSAQTKITLAQAIDSTLSNNIQIKLAQFDEATNQEDLKLAKAARYPTLNGSMSGYRLFGRTVDPTTNDFTSSAANLAQGTLYANVILFQGFQRLNQIKQNKYFLEANMNNVRKIKNDLTLSVLTGYLQVLSNRDLLAASKQQLIIAKQELNRQQKFLKVGQKTLADFSQAKSQVANAEANVTNAQNEIERSYLILAQLMEWHGDAIEVVDPTKDQIDNLNTKYTAIDVYLKALKNYPDILVATNQRLALEKGIDIARGGALPTLSFGAGLTTSYSSNAAAAVTTQITGTVPIGIVANSNAEVLSPTYATQSIPFKDQISHNFSQVVGFSLFIPIANGFSAKINTRKAHIAYESAVATEELAKLNINKVVAEAVWDLQATNKKYKSAIVTYNSAADAFKVMQQRYSVGLVNGQDLNIAETSKNVAEFAMIQTKYDLIFKNKLIDYYLGNRISF